MSFDEATGEAAVQAAVGLPLIPNPTAPGCLGMANVDAQVCEREQREWYLRHCIEQLLQARRIRQDAALMQEIKTHLRLGRDELGLLLDEIGA
jgi:hypothetical protein